MLWHTGDIGGPFVLLLLLLLLCCQAISIGSCHPLCTWSQSSTNMLLYPRPVDGDTSYYYK